MMPRKAQPRKKPALSSSKSREKALIIHPVLSVEQRREAGTYISTPEEQAQEAVGLAHAIYLDVMDVRLCRVAEPSPGYLLGKGTRADIQEQVANLKPNVVIVNRNLSPVQQRNLEKEWKVKVIDRTGLILEIFAARAQTKEGQIQVELAALQYQRARLVRLWTHLERQRGGGGFMGGPGEKQNELDRRRIAEKINRLKRDLEQIRRNRELQRKSRERVPFPIVAIVGYTNAGKSTLFNHMTGADVFAEDLLFATLDPTMRRVTLENGQEVIMSDTVGFIADLPTHLVAAFRATLEQTKFADIILHVRDIARPDTDIQKQDVIETMAGLGIDYETDQRIIEVLNKTDLLDEDARQELLHQAKFGERLVAISALTGEGVGELLAMIQRHVSRNRQTVTYKIPPETAGKALAWLHENGKVLAREDDMEYIIVTVNIEPAHIGRIRERFSLSPVTADKNDDKKYIHGQ